MIARARAADLSVLRRSVYATYFLRGVIQHLMLSVCELYDRLIARTPGVRYPSAVAMPPASRSIALETTMPVRYKVHGQSGLEVFQEVATYHGEDTRVAFGGIGAE